MPLDCFKLLSLSINLNEVNIHVITETKASEAIDLNYGYFEFDNQNR